MLAHENATSIASQICSTVPNARFITPTAASTLDEALIRSGMYFLHHHFKCPDPNVLASPSFSS